MIFMQPQAFNLMPFKRARKEMSLGTVGHLPHPGVVRIFVYLRGGCRERKKKAKRDICTSIVTCFPDQITVSVKGVFAKSSVSRWPGRNGGSRLFPPFHPLFYIPSLCLCSCSVNFVTLVGFCCHNKSNCLAFSSSLLCVPLEDRKMLWSMVILVRSEKRTPLTQKVSSLCFKVTLINR